MKKTFEKMRDERGLSIEDVETGAKLPHNSLIGIETGKHISAQGIYCLANFFGIELDKQILIEYGIIVKQGKRKDCN